MESEQGMARGAMGIFKIVVMIACYTLEATAAPAIPETGVVEYLSKFGYLQPINPESQAILSEEIFSKAISEFQSFMGINVTGTIDAETAHVMSLPRCGVKDKVGYSSDKRSKRFALFGSKWPVKSLTYEITQYCTKLERTIVDQEIARALAVWSEYTDLIFTRGYGNADIEIRFEDGEHGDNDAFDGPGGTLAHAHSPGPEIGGDAHFDNSEVWTVNTYQGINLFQVAAHEFGHSLGLDHSQIRAALMAPVYRSYQPNFQLHEDDIVGIQSLYGQKTGNGGFDLCENPQIDTIFGTDDGYVYVFKGDRYWRLTSNGIESGYPKLIATGWRGLPSNIDAAFTHNGRTYFFKGSEYWTYIGNRMENHSPRKIRNNFRGIPDNIDAATVGNSDGLMYFFKGSKLWRYRPTQWPLIRKTYSEPISNWPGLSGNIDAALSHNGDTYFFKGGSHYIFNDGSFSMKPASPYQTGFHLFGCNSDTNNIPNIYHNWW